MDISNLLTYFCYVMCLAFIQSSANSNAFKDIFAQATGCSADSEEEWSYKGDKGPEFWGETYPHCYRSKQSPILIEGNRVITDKNLEPLQFILYDFPITDATIVNNGKTIQVIPDFPLARGFVADGVYYGLYEIHFHWGSIKSKGAEHVIDKKRYAMEMHLLHKNVIENRLAVVGVFFDQDNGINAELQHFVNELPKVAYKGANITTRWRINLMNLLPEQQPAPIYRYEGSLTTPDCEEGVTWSLLKTPVLVGNNQIREFRKISSASRDRMEAGCRMSDNFRPLQPLRGRKVYSSA